MKPERKKEIIKDLSAKGWISDEDVNVLAELNDTIFCHHTAEDTNTDMDKLFFSFIASDAAELTDERQSVIESYIRMKRLLHCLIHQEHPDNIGQLQFNTGF